MECGPAVKMELEANQGHCAGCSRRCQRHDYDEMLK